MAKTFSLQENSSDSNPGFSIAERQALFNFLCFYALVVQWLGPMPSKYMIGVRFSPSALSFRICRQNKSFAMSNDLSNLSKRVVKLLKIYFENMGMWQTSNALVLQTSL